MTLSRLSVVASAAFTLGCAEATEPRLHSADDILVTTAADHLTVENRGTAAFFYAVFEQWSLAYTDWIPLTTGPRLAPGDRAVITYADLLRHVSSNSGNAVVYWWYAEDAGPSGIVPPDKVRSITVPME